MPITERLNNLDNPGFTLWGYGSTFDLAALPANGYVAERWKIVGSGYSGTVKQGVTPSGSNIPKWLRGVACMELDITAIAPGATLEVTQIVEDGQTYSRSTAILSAQVYGPVDAEFYMGMYSLHNVVKTTMGPDYPTRIDCPITLPDLPTPNMPVVIFGNPKSIGRYLIVWGQLILGASSPVPPAYELPPTATNRARNARYTAPLYGGFAVEAVSATEVRGVRQFRERMRAAPSLVNPSATITLIGLDGSSKVASAPVISIPTTTANGVRVVIGGFTDLTVGATYMVQSSQLGIMHADI